MLELDDGTVLCESIAICRYFEEMVPEPPLFGRSTLERAQVEMWNRRMEHELLLPVIDVFVHTHPFWVGKREQLPVWGEAQRKVLVERMRWLDSELEGRAFIGIDRYNMADITAQVALLTARGVAKLPIRRITEPVALVGLGVEAADGSGLASWLVAPTRCHPERSEGSTGHEHRSLATLGMTLCVGWGQGQIT